MELDPESSAAHAGLGDVYSKYNNNIKALDEYKKAYSLNTSNVNVLIKLGNIYKEQSKYNEAQLYYKKALDIEPANFSAKFNMGLVMAETGDLKRAKEYYNDVITTKPDFSYVYYALASLNEKERNYKDAIANYQKFLSLSKNDENASDVRFRLKLLKDKLLK